MAFTTTYSAPSCPRSSVPGPLDAGAADKIAGPVALGSLVGQLLLVDLAGVAQQVGRERTVGIAAQRLDHHVHPGQLAAMLLDPDQHRGRRVAPEHRRLPAPVRGAHHLAHAERVELDQRGEALHPLRSLGGAHVADALGRHGTKHDVERR
jgi:hypothetical protein